MFGLDSWYVSQTNLSHLYLEAVSAYTLSFTGPNAKAGETEQVFEAEKYEYLKYKQFCIDRLESDAIMMTLDNCWYFS